MSIILICSLIANLVLLIMFLKHKKIITQLTETCNYSEKKILNLKSQFDSSNLNSKKEISKLKRNYASKDDSLS